jgi:hypothetical protein
VEPYVTPERFKTMGFGIDLDAVEDSELRSVLRRASDRVNAITAAPGLPVPHDFRGGSITAEEHHYRMGGINEAAQRSIRLWHTPIKAVSDLRILLTNSQGVVFDSTELMVFDKEVEIVSLAMTSAGLFGSFIVPEIGLAQPRIQADYTYGYSVPIVKQILDATDGRTFRGQDQWWDSGEDVIVYDDEDSVIADTNYTVHHDEGTIEFGSNQDPDEIRKASFTTKMPPGIATATGILAAEALGDRETRTRGMSGLRSVRVGEIELEKEMQMRGGTTLVTPAVAEAESLLAPYRFIWAGA